MTVDQTSGAAFHSLIDSVNPEDFCRIIPPIDQKQHLNRIFCGAHIPENDGNFFWIFDNIDYKEWMQNLRTLVLSAPPERNLEQGAYYIVRHLQEVDAVTLPLYFFYRAAERRHYLIWESMDKHEQLIAVSLHTLLYQLIGFPNFSKLRSQSIVAAFLNHLLECRIESELAKMVTGDQLENLKPLLAFATLKDLWDAFEKALDVALDIGLSNNGSHHPALPAGISLTLIFDLDDAPIATWRLLLENMRTLQRHLPVVKLLITNPPTAGDLGLETARSEIHIEYDKERKGFIAHSNYCSLFSR